MSLLQRASRRIIRLHPFFFFMKEKFGFRRYQTLYPDEYLTTSTGERISINGILSNLRKYGIAVIPSYYSKEWVDAAYKKTLALNAEVEAGRIPADETGNLFSQNLTWSKPLESQGIIRIHHVDKMVPEACAFRDDELFQRIGKLYYGESIFNLVTISQYNRTFEGGTRSYHIDSHLNQFKTFVYLNDVDETNGPHDYVLGSHQISYRNMRIIHRAYLSGNTSVDPAVAESIGEHRNFVGPKGSVLLVDTRGIHQGSSLLSGHRLIFANYYYLERNRAEISGN